MLTEVKKTVHIVVDDMHAVPDETMIQHALNRETKAMDVMHRDPRQMCFDEHGDAMQAGMGLVPRMTDAEKVCPPIDAHNVSYYVWIVDMHFTRVCAFEPKATPLRSIVAVVDEKCKELADGIVGRLPAAAREVAVTNEIAGILHELFAEGMFSLAD